MSYPDNKTSKGNLAFKNRHTHHGCQFDRIDGQFLCHLQSHPISQSNYVIIIDNEQYNPSKQVSSMVRHMENGQYFIATVVIFDNKIEYIEDIWIMSDMCECEIDEKDEDFIRDMFD
jgi:hypothetical protein